MRSRAFSQRGPEIAMGRCILVGVDASLSQATWSALESVCQLIEQDSSDCHPILLHVIPVPYDPTPRWGKIGGFDIHFPSHAESAPRGPTGIVDGSYGGTPAAWQNVTPRCATGSVSRAACSPTSSIPLRRACRLVCAGPVVLPPAGTSAHGLDARGRGPTPCLWCPKCRC